jgi:catechol 2,3-dioxygenase-like lactoylglutathione lyase family enzyme
MKIDHIALPVDDIYEACGWYRGAFKANLLYHDKSWALLEFENVKLALFLRGSHPDHFAIEVNPENFEKLEFKEHRDGSKYHYLTDPWGNCVELINYGKNSSENS